MLKEKILFEELKIPYESAGSYPLVDWETAIRAMQRYADEKMNTGNLEEISFERNRTVVDVDRNDDRIDFVIKVKNTGEEQYKLLYNTLKLQWQWLMDNDGNPYSKDFIETLLIEMRTKDIIF